MSETPRIAQADATHETAQDAPGATIVTSGDLQVPLISSLAEAHVGVQGLNVLDSVRAIEEGVDAAVPVDAQHAPTRDLEHCRQFSTAPTPIIIFLEEERRTTSERQKQHDPTVHQIGSGPNSRSTVTHVPGLICYLCSRPHNGHNSAAVPGNLSKKVN